uniref:aminoacylase-1-like n=1 Tax=Styela clava TaxID=7725 RepID=UPI0019397D20|nr:aminoacylase-1-like [Styela clava]
MENRKVVVMTLFGRNPDLPSVLLNSHVDVGSAVLQNWARDPWSAYKDEKGNIYGMGIQDMKSVSIQYLEAVRVLKILRNTSFERTVHLSFVPDEQINNGTLGMALFVHTPEFKAMNVGVVIDEGLACPDNKYYVFYGERSPWWVHVKCRGNAGHAAMFIDDTACDKVQKVIKSFTDYRNKEQKRFKGNHCQRLGDFTTINVTGIHGGVHSNAVPDEFTAAFDIRIPPTVNLHKFEEKIKTWCHEAGDDVTYEFLNKNTNQKTTPTDSLWWKTFVTTLRQRNVEVLQEIFCAFSDGRFLREAGYQVIGFSPMRNTTMVMYERDEYLNEKIFLEGIDVYCDLIPALANLTF